MTAIIRLGAGVYTPMVRATAVLPLPPFPDGETADVADREEITELELLNVWGPPSVVASALDALGAHLDELVPMIGALYNDHAQPQDGD